MKNHWIDISISLHNGTVSWPGDPTIKIARFCDLNKGDSSNVSQIFMSVHTGTHIDAPKHFFEEGQSLDLMPITTTVGNARVVEIQDTECIKPAELQTLNLKPQERILFKTQNSSGNRQNDTFTEKYVYISPKAAQYLVKSKVQCIGIDALSVDDFHNHACEAHRILLNAGIWIIEGLNLEKVKPGSYELICLPLKIIGSDSAPARAVIRITSQL